MKILKWPILYIIIPYLIMFIWAIVYTMTGNSIETFNLFLEKYAIFLTISVALIFIPLLKHNYKIKDNKINKKDIIYSILLGLSLSIVYNTIIYYLNNSYHFTNIYEGNPNILLAIISSGLVGPIIEEYIMRGIIYNELKKKYPIMKSIVLATLIFALFHLNFIQMIYALVLGFILIYVYEKSKNIKIPIILHITSNITTTLYVLLLNKGNLPIIIVLYILSLTILIFSKIKYINLKKQ